MERMDMYERRERGCLAGLREPGKVYTHFLTLSYLLAACMPLLIASYIIHQVLSRDNVGNPGLHLLGYSIAMHFALAISIASQYRWLHRPVVVWLLEVLGYAIVVPFVIWTAVWTLDSTVDFSSDRRPPIWYHAKTVFEQNWNRGQCEQSTNEDALFVCQGSFAAQTYLAFMYNSSFKQLTAECLKTEQKANYNFAHAWCYMFPNIIAQIKRDYVLNFVLMAITIGMMLCRTGVRAFRWMQRL